MEFEYRSPLALGGLPLLHVAFGHDPITGRRRVARGVVAVGRFAIGGIAVGQVSCGAIAVGQIAVGIAGAAGQLAAGFHAAGQLAFAAGLAVGQLACGFVARGEAAWDGRASTTAVMLIWIVAAAGLARASWPRWRRWARLVPPGGAGSIAEAPAGAVTLRGRVVAVRTLEAPVTRRACVAYRVRARGPGTRAGGRAREELTAEDFLIEDGTGRARVIAAEARFLLARTPRVRAVLASASRAAGESRTASGARPLPSPSPSPTPARDEVFEERVLAPGELVTVAGTATRIVAQGRAGAGPAPPRVAIHGGARAPVLVSSHPPHELRAALWLTPLVALGLLVAALAAGTLY